VRRSQHRAVVQMPFGFIAKHRECAADKSGNAVRVTASTSPVDETAKFENGRKMTTVTHRIEG